MKEANKELIKQAKDLIDLSIENYPNYHSRKDVINCIRTDRVVLSIRILCAETEKIDFVTYINNWNYFRIIDIDDSKDSSTIDISSRYANLEVIYTVMIDDNDMYLTNNMAIRLLNDPDNEVWLYESELSELY